MARVVVVLLVVACARSMEMHETVERMVMVRKTGSDLQPEASGFIYKKNNDGPASVVKMQETEVMEHLSKLYEQPKAFAAPIPIAAGPFYAKEDDGKVAVISSETKVIPVIEEQQDTSNNDKLDGIADEEYGKILEENASDYGKYKSDFDNYLKSLGYFQDGVYHEYAGNGENEADEQKDENKDKEEHGNKRSFENGGAGDYHTAKYESYQISEKGGHEQKNGDADSYDKYYGEGHEGNGAVQSQDGFLGHFDKDKYKKDYGGVNGEALKSGFNKFSDRHIHYGSESGKFKEGGNHESELNEFGNGDGFYDGQSEDEHRTFSDEGRSPEYLGDFGSRVYGGKFYGFQIKH